MLQLLKSVIKDVVTRCCMDKHMMGRLIWQVIWMALSAKFEERNQKLYSCTVWLLPSTFTFKSAQNQAGRLGILMLWWGSCTTSFNYHLNVLRGWIDLKMNLLLQNPTLKPMCPTRWTVRSAAIDVVLKIMPYCSYNWRKFMKIPVGGVNQSSWTAPINGKSTTYFGLKLSYLAFVATEQRAITLRGKEVNAQVSTSAVNPTKSFLQRQRSTESFNTFYQSAIVESQNQKLTSELVLSRQNSQDQSVEAYFRQHYFEVLDILNDELERRFDPSLKLPVEIQRLLIDVRYGNAGQPSGTKRLEAQLAMLPDLGPAHMGKGYPE